MNSHVCIWSDRQPLLHFSNLKSFSTRSLRLSTVILIHYYNRPCGLRGCGITILKPYILWQCICITIAIHPVMMSSNHNHSSSIVTVWRHTSWMYVLASQLCRWQRFCTLVAAMIIPSFLTLSSYNDNQSSAAIPWLKCWPLLLFFVG